MKVIEISVTFDEEYLEFPGELFYKLVEEALQEKYPETKIIIDRKLGTGREKIDSVTEEGGELFEDDTRVWPKVLAIIDDIWAEIKKG